MKIAVIPIDNRPVCYDLIQQIAGIDDDLELFLPDIKLLGGLHSNAKIDGIIDWLENLEKVDAIVVSLDTIAYGGLIPSRRSADSLEDIKIRLERVKKLLKKGKKVYAFSSIMRISNNNVNEEEKEYWSLYGKQIFEYSFNFHKNGEDTIDFPQEILSDYLSTRRRNFSVNKIYLDWCEQGIFDTLVFSKDDCAEFGLNVLESEILAREIKKRNLSALVKTGADEIPLTLFARAFCDYNANKAPKISAKFLAPEFKSLISNYEDISIEKSVEAQIELSGARSAQEEDADIVLLVNNFEDHQGEIVMGVKTKPFGSKLKLLDKKYMIADVRFANGADNKFVEKLFKIRFDFEKFYGYSAWNTSANTLGSLICAAVVKFCAKKYNDEEFKKLQLTRFLDDWAYQANVRQELKSKGKKTSKPDIKKLKKAMESYEKKLKEVFSLSGEISYKFPWDRFFEVKVIIK